MPQNTKNKWFVFEEIFKVNPQTATSYAFYFDKDYLRNYLRKDLGLKNYPPQEVLFIYKNGNAKLCHKLPALEILAKKILEKTLRNPLWALKTNKDIKKRSDKVIKIGQKILKTNLKKLSDKEIYNLYQKYYLAHIYSHSSGWFGNYLDFNGIFTQYLSNYLEKKREKIQFDLSIPETLSALTEAQKLSNAQKEESDILLILKFINNFPKIKSLFLKENLKSILNILENSQDPRILRVNSLIEDHTKKYNWLSYQFEGPGWDKNYFVERIKELVISKVNPYRLIKEIKEKPQKAIKNQKEIAKKLKIDNDLLKLFQIYAEITFLKGYRKDALFFGCYARDLIFKEISDRLNIPLKFLRYVYFTEMKGLILKKIVPKDLYKRFTFHLYLYQEGKRSKILVSTKAKEFIRKLKWQKQEIKEIKELKGMCASPGKIKGRVVIVNIVEDMKKIKKGEILVSEATSPDLMPAIKKASAIVTNVGGITCHAAIVSREFNIPCIIGTKIATKVLKDGDLVEIDAGKGVVKILKRKK